MLHRKCRIADYICVQVSLSPLQDDVVVIHVAEDYATLLEVSLKTEFITTIVKKVEDRTGRKLKIEFLDT